MRWDGICWVKVALLVLSTLSVMVTCTFWEYCVCAYVSFLRYMTQYTRHPSNNNVLLTLSHRKVSLSRTCHKDNKRRLSSITLHSVIFSDVREYLCDTYVRILMIILYLCDDDCVSSPFQCVYFSPRHSLLEQIISCIEDNLFK